MSPRNLFEVAPRLLFGRFQVLEELGAGLQGSVVRAFDTFARGEVALKILRVQQGSHALVRFKTEFRTLAGLVHPNLVRLGELFERDQVWAFSMELVRGGDFLSWVREGGSFSESRLRAGLAQIVSALSTLHAARLIHRDIKPENLRVTPDGRVVLVDFGMVAEHGPSARTASQQLVGTVGYIAPEVLGGELAAAKSDLYALGTLLYQALTGVLPYDGTLFQVALAQRAGLPPRPASLCAAVPPDLDELCMALLANDPENRPSTEEVRAQLCAEPAAARELAPEPRPELFVGREAELARLHQLLFDQAGSGLRGVLFGGESGIGKSALLAAFIRETRHSNPRCVVLSGQCHAREHVSYNAFDDVFAGLARLLVRLGAAERRAVLRQSAGLLPTLSAHFGRVPDLSGATLLSGAEAERTQLFDAFIDLLAALSQRLPLLLSVEDVHWADSDSVQLLKSMLERSAQLSLGLILTSRCVLPQAELPEPAHEILSDPRLHTLLLPPLDAASAEQLLAHVLPPETPGRALDQLREEAAGSPIFLIELALARDPHRELTSLDGALHARFSALPPHARAVLEGLAVAAAPISSGVLMTALDMPIEELYGALSLLRRERLACDTPAAELATYHDRVTQAVLSALDPTALTRVHAALARAFEQPSFLNALRAAQHWLLAGEPVRAAPWLEQAAARALDGAVFEQAAELYQQRLSLAEVPQSESARRDLQIKLADALAAAGHCSASARVLLAALAGADHLQRRELSLRAAQQLLQAGEIAQGLDAAALALREVDLSWRKSAGSALVHLALGRAQLRSSQVPPLPAGRADAALVSRQLDTLMQLAHPLVWSDLARSMELSARGLLLAMRERRTDYLPMLLAAEAAQATLRNPDSDQGALLLGQATSWLRPDSASRERAYCTWAAGATSLLKTRYAEAAGLLREAERMYRVECPGEAWMRVNARGMLLNSLIGMGAHLEFVQQAEQWLREAQAKGDAYARAYYCVGGQAALRHLLSDAPEAASAEIELVMQPWRESWGLHQLLRLKCLHDVLSYAGGDRAHEWWQRGRRISPLTPAFFAEGFAWRRADAALRAGIARGDRALVRSAERMLKPLARAATPYVRVFSALTTLQIAVLTRRDPGARQLAAAIEPELRAQDDFRTFVYEALVRALDAPEHALPAIWSALHAWFAVRGWQNPERALAWIVPISAAKGPVRWR